MVLIISKNYFFGGAGAGAEAEAEAEAGVEAKRYNKGQGLQRPLCVPLKMLVDVVSW